jgi:hypothetical protein
LCDFLSEDVVHHGLKGCWRICESKEHNRWFEQSFARFKGCLPFVSLFDTDVVVSPSYVEFGEQFLSGEVVDQFSDERKWVFIGDSPLVQSSIVLDWSELSVFLFDKEESAGVGGVGSSDPLET